MEYEPSPSKTGVQVVPAFSVFHTPPEATATKKRCRLPGVTANSTTRPELMAGPMLRNFRADSVDADSLASSVSSSAA
jgi:hypothetical protein